MQSRNFKIAFEREGRQKNEGRDYVVLCKVIFFVSSFHASFESKAIEEQSRIVDNPSDEREKENFSRRPKRKTFAFVLCFSSSTVHPSFITFYLNKLAITVLIDVISFDVKIFHHSFVGFLMFLWRFIKWFVLGGILKSFLFHVTVNRRLKLRLFFKAKLCSGLKQNAGW